MMYTAAMELTKSQHQLIRPFFFASAWECVGQQPRSPQCDFVCGGAEVQVARVTQAFWELACHLYPH